MEYLNNKYNFKNPIRHFFNLDDINFDAADSVKYEGLIWTEPVKFKIFKTENSTRTINFPNILNFYKALEKFESISDFFKIKESSSRKRVSPDLSTGEFSVMSYGEAIQKDLFNLTKYDKLLILDIKSFYGRIYTHDLGYEKDAKNDTCLEQRLTSLNRGKTNGLLLGSYLSLYLAEKVLLKIENQLITALEKSNIKCYFEYFSDDFYFFCNNKDIFQIKNVFSNVLDQYDLQYNDEKTLLLDFEEYSKSNNLDKQWKKVINHAISKDEEYNKASKTKNETTKYPTFLTQLVYRLNMISELKYKRVFINNFFKTVYFNSFVESEYTLSQSDFNYLCYIYKLMPESMLYSLNKMKKMKGFNSRQFKEYISTRFKATLDTEKHEEQLYVYFAIKTCGYTDILSELKRQVLDSKNQVLISYFIMDKVITKEDYQSFILDPKENEWLQNYHYVLVYDKNQIDILIPKNVKQEKQRNSYNEFYKGNIDKGISIVRPTNNFEKAIESYIDLRLDSFNN